MFNLNKTDEKELEKLSIEGDAKEKMRAKALLMKWKVSNIDEIMEELNKSKSTIYAWFKEFEQDGIKSLKTKKSGGVNALLNTTTDLEKVQQCIDQFPPCSDNRDNYNQIRALFRCVIKKTKVNMQLKSFKEYLRKNNIDDYFDNRPEHLQEYHSKKQK